MIRSIRVTLALWYVGMLAITLCIFGFLIYQNVVLDLEDDITQALASYAEDLGDDVFAFWEAEWEATHKALSPSVDRERLAESRKLQTEVEAGKFLDLVERWAKGTGQIEGARPARLLDINGNVTVASANFAKLNLPVTKTALAQAKSGLTVYETFNLSESPLRMVTRPVIEDGRVLYLIQAVAFLKVAYGSMDNLRLRLIWFIPLTVFFTIAVGWFLAKRALRPVDVMIRQAQEIGVHDLHQRIDTPRSGDELERLAVTFNDMLARLERAFRRMRQFGAAASHELRTPLTVMKGELEVALRRPRENEEYKQALEPQRGALNEMVSIVEQLLMLAQSEEGEGMIEFNPVELGKLGKQVCNNLRSIAAVKNVRVDIFFQKPVWVRGEKRLLERLVTNLLENAIKHSPDRGYVELKVLEHENHARLVVEDGGPGISSHDFPKIFDKFFIREPNPNGSKSTGLGLGLCRWIAEAHQGRIEVSSPPGRGAIFTVWIPLFLQPAAIL